MVILSPFDVRSEREISFDASHRTLFQKDDSGDWGEKIRAMSSRAVCNAVSVRACCSLFGCCAAKDANGDAEIWGVDDFDAAFKLRVGIAVTWESRCTGDPVAASALQEWTREYDTGRRCKGET